MNGIDDSRLEEFAVAARNFCVWATSPVVQDKHEVGLAIQYLSALFSAGCALGWEEGEPRDARRPDQGIEAVRAKAEALPFRYYSEVFNNLVIPPEEPVVGDIAPALALYESGELVAAKAHWLFWLSRHWGEHATSALRVLWSFLAGRKGRE